eukprot:TRINITY_DN24599_c0_g1_i1.p1 TRINITY_DN24599_c0_g1~~TRINITY_DN24599_c0_g1_i1.p1  ORF type:complete len:399 (+),score=25.58 TRINITY_DN24599_c0_g1_i1:58-1197(+)
MRLIALAKRSIIVTCGYCQYLSVCQVADWCYPPVSSDGRSVNGGYGGGDVPKALEDQCHIDILDAQLDSPSKVFRRCYNVPCLIRNVVDSWWMDAWMLTNLSDVYGDIEVKTNTASNQVGTWRKLSTFIEADMLRLKSAQELRSNVPKIWDGIDIHSRLGFRLRQETNNFAEIPWSYVSGDSRLPYRRAIGLHPNRDRVIPQGIADYYAVPHAVPLADSFVAGGPCAGTFIHRHGPAVATLPHGMKRWAFAHPRAQLNDFTPNYSTYEDASASHYAFFEDYVPRSLREATKHVESDDGQSHPVLLCTQRSGDAIFTPGGWWHGTINILSSVAAVTELRADSNEKIAEESNIARLSRDRDVASLYERYRGFYPGHGLSEL